MPLNDIVFQKGEGGLGRPLLGKDHYSGLLWYGNYPTANVPAESFSADVPVKAIYRIEDAEKLGIVDSGDTGVFHYHISEFFRMNKQGVLYVGIFPKPVDDASYTFMELKTLQQHANGELRQAGIWTDIENINNTEIAKIQAICDELASEHKPISVLYTADISGVVDLSTLVDLRTLTAPNVSVIIGEDGNNTGKALAGMLGLSVSCIGAVLGALSFAKVNESLVWVQKFKMSTDELDVAAFSNGDKVVDKAQSELDALNDKGYIFLRKHVGIDGSYINDSHTATALTSDYAYIENVRTIDKAIRNTRTVMLPALGSPVRLTNGKLAPDFINHLESLGNQALAQMARDSELSEYQTIINPEQEILTTSTIETAMEINPIGIGRNFKINTSFVTQLS